MSQSHGIKGGTTRSMFFCLKILQMHRYETLRRDEKQKQKQVPLNQQRPRSEPGRQTEHLNLDWNGLSRESSDWIRLTEQILEGQGRFNLNCTTPQDWWGNWGRGEQVGGDGPLMGMTGKEVAAGREGGIWQEGRHVAGTQSRRQDEYLELAEVVTAAISSRLFLDDNMIISSVHCRLKTAYSRGTHFFPEKSIFVCREKKKKKKEAFSLWDPYR